MKPQDPWKDRTQLCFFLTHTVQMKLVYREDYDILMYNYFLTHTVQMKLRAFQEITWWL